MPAPSTKRSTAYRVDLDGLRGFAIALVVLFHVYVGRVSGGVDVFLLLSGYFFLGGQIRYAMRPNPSLNPWWPLWRTIRRLVPALALTVLATMLGVMLLAPELMGVELSKQFTASMLYYQNWELIAQDADYAAASQDTSPLQHLWSMSVQGQFYVFAILLGTLLAFLIWKCKVPAVIAKRGAITLLAIITVASFAYAARFGFVGTGQNYYSTFSRAWELALGGLLAFVPTSRFLPQRTAAWTAGLGVVMISITGIVVTTSLAFPGPVTLLPLTGAALIVMSGNQNSVSNILASKPMTWLGSIAYSLYLWHWPLLIIVTLAGGFGTPPWWVGTLVIAVSLGLAHVTHLLVEDPLRQHRKRPQSTDTPIIDARSTLRTRTGVVRAGGGVLVSVLVATIFAIQPLWNQRIEDADRDLPEDLYPGALAIAGAEVPDVKPQPDPALIAGIYPPIGVDECMIMIPQPATDMPRPDCQYGDLESDVTVVMTGGSHIEPYVVPLDKLGKEHHFRVIPYVRQECPIVIGGADRDEFVSDVCAQWSELAFQNIVEMNPDLVISNSTRPEGHAGGAAFSTDKVPDAYANLWQNFAYYGIPFVGLRDNPWMFTPEGDPMDPNLCIVAGASERDCSALRSTIYGPEDPATSYLLPENHQWSIDTADWFCDDKFCPPQRGNVYIYRDQNHISNAYAATLAPLLWAELMPIFEELGLLPGPATDPTPSLEMDAPATQ